MPTYEYACKACGEHLEVVQSFKDDALTECPNCGGELRKVFGSIGIVFKGSGFYKNDSRTTHRATEAGRVRVEHRVREASILAGRGRQAELGRQRRTGKGTQLHLAGPGPGPGNSIIGHGDP